MTGDQQQVAATLVQVYPDALVARSERAGKLCMELAGLGVCAELEPREDTWRWGAWVANPVYVEAVRGNPSMN